MIYDPATVTLDDIRPMLAEKSEALIKAVYRRLTHPYNGKAYRPGGIPVKESGESYFMHAYRKKQMMDAELGRFLNAGEVPFFEDLPDPDVERPAKDYPLGHSGINMNHRIMDSYMEMIMTSCARGDDGNWGEAVLADIEALDVFSSRAHHGIIVVDLKYRGDEKAFGGLGVVAHSGDEDARDEILRMITDPRQESRVMDAVAKIGERHNVPVGLVQNLFMHHVIPITKDIEVARVEELAMRAVQ